MTLTAEERDELDRLISRGKADARKLAHARVLLLADVSEAAPGWSGAAISEALRIRKLHLAVDGGTGQIVASALPDRNVDDGAEVGSLLDRVSGSVGSFTGDGAYGQEGVYAGVAPRHPEAAVIVPPRDGGAEQDGRDRAHAAGPTSPAHRRARAHDLAAG